MLSSTAILIFCRLPHEEMLHKRISTKIDANLALWQFLYNKTFEEAEKTGLPIIAFSEENQKGKTFAEKISNAINDTYNRGFENLIVLGTDCPKISQRQIEAAHKELLIGKQIVAGQDKRGGIYLLGLNKKAFKAENFLGFSWQTNSLFNDIKKFAVEFSFTKLSSILNDLNSAKDAATIFNYVLINKHFKMLLKLLLTVFKTNQQILSESIKSFSFAFYYILRGPPSLS